MIKIYLNWNMEEVHLGDTLSINGEKPILLNRETLPILMKEGKIVLQDQTFYEYDMDEFLQMIYDKYDFESFGISIWDFIHYMGERSQKTPGVVRSMLLRTFADGLNKSYSTNAEYGTYLYTVSFYDLRVMRSRNRGNLDSKMKDICIFRRADDAKVAVNLTNNIMYYFTHASK